MARLVVQQSVQRGYSSARGCALEPGACSHTWLCHTWHGNADGGYDCLFAYLRRCVCGVAEINDASTNKCHTRHAREQGSAASSTAHGTVVARGGWRSGTCADVQLRALRGSAQHQQNFWYSTEMKYECLPSLMTVSYGCIRWRPPLRSGATAQRTRTVVRVLYSYGSGSGTIGTVGKGYLQFSFFHPYDRWSLKNGRRSLKYFEGPASLQYL